MERRLWGESSTVRPRLRTRGTKSTAVVYSGQVPQFKYAPGCSAFLIEGVSAFIEVKTKLTKPRLKAAIKTAKRIKEYPRDITQKINPSGLVKKPSALFVPGCLRWMQSQDVGPVADGGP